MLHREIMTIFSEIHTKHINTVCGQNVELLNVKLTVHVCCLYFVLKLSALFLEKLRVNGPTFCVVSVSRSVTRHYRSVGLSLDSVGQSFCHSTVSVSRSVTRHYRSVGLSLDSVGQSVCHSTVSVSRSVTRQCRSVGLSLDSIGQSVCHLKCNSGREAEPIFTKFNVSRFIFTVCNFRSTSHNPIHIPTIKAPLYPQPLSVYLAVRTIFEQIKKTNSHFVFN
jgi:hypothetical protein